MPTIDFAKLPAPKEGILVGLFITVRKVARSRDDIVAYTSLRLYLP